MTGLLDSIDAGLFASTDARLLDSVDPLHPEDQKIRIKEPRIARSKRPETN